MVTPDESIFNNIYASVANNFCLAIFVWVFLIIEKWMSHFSGVKNMWVQCTLQGLQLVTVLSSAGYEVHMSRDSCIYLVGNIPKTAVFVTFE